MIKIRNMKVTNVKTRKEFDKFSNSWYHRTHRLRWVWQDQGNTLEKREKAFVLFNVMVKRMITVGKIYTKINQQIIK